MRLSFVKILILLSFGFIESQLINNRLNGLLNLFRPRPVVPRRGLSRPRPPPLAARQIGGRPRPRDARLRGQQQDKESRFARAPVLKNYVPPATNTITITTTTPTIVTTATTRTTTLTHTTTTTPLKTRQHLYFGGEDTEPELQWYPMKHEKVIELQSYNQEPLSWKDAEILQSPDPEPLKLFQNTVVLKKFSPENIIDLTSTLKSGDMLSQRPGHTHVHLTESQVTDLDYTHGPSDQGASLHGHGAHHESSDPSLAPQQVSAVEGETQEPRVTHSGVTLPFLNHQDAESDFDYSISINNEPATLKYEGNTEDFTTHPTYVTESEDSFEDFYNEVEDQVDYAEDNDNIIERNVDDDDYGVQEARRNIPNANFKSDFFKSMNIQEMVFSIPSHFRKYLDEPPEWINKDYW